MPYGSNSGYAPGSSFTNVTSGPSGMDVSKYLQALLQAEQRNLGQRNAAATPKRTMGLGGAKSRGGGVRQLSGNVEGSSRKSGAQMAQEAAVIAGAQAATMPAPLRMVGGAGITPGYMMDVNAMSGAQRQAYLPQNSELVGGGGESTPKGPAKVYGGPFSDFNSAADEEGYWRNREIQALAAARARQESK